MNLDRIVAQEVSEPPVEESPASVHTRVQSPEPAGADSQDLLRALRQIEALTRPGSAGASATVHQIAEAAIRDSASSGVESDSVREAAAEMLSALRLVKGKMSIGRDYDPPYMSFNDILTAVKNAIASAEKVGRFL